MPKHWLTLLIAVISCILWRNTACGRPAVIYSTQERLVSIDLLAQACAPVLWFSPDEPLIGKADSTIAIPSSFPFLSQLRGPVVYYFPVELKLNGRPLAHSAGEVDLQTLDTASIRFYFYYPQDIGGGSHEHDIEGAIFELKVDRDQSTYEVYIARVLGEAHGIPGMSNILDLSELREWDAVSLPITLLVEEGKHATCPDRNGDGVYTPGFDTNRWVNDAWGVRDVFGSGRMGRSYASWMTKARPRWSRLRPSEYRLQAIGAHDWESRPVDKHLEKLLKKNRVGMPDKNSFWNIPPVYIRKDQEVMWGLVMPWWTFKEDNRPDELPVVGGNMGFKMDFGYPFGNSVDLGVFYSPSLSRWSDWYAVLGVDASTTATRFAMEGGLQIRPVNPSWGIINRLVARVGVKTLVYNTELFDTRMTFELGVAP